MGRVRLDDVERGIPIDSCKVCYGPWLDGGELEILRSKGLFGRVASFFRRLVR
jgi:Zn-finger nucleic acid-binding protein